MIVCSWVSRTPVIIRVANAERLDYESETGRTFVFKINAVQGQFPAIGFSNKATRDLVGLFTNYKRLRAQ